MKDCKKWSASEAESPFEEDPGLVQEDKTLNLNPEHKVGIRVIDNQHEWIIRATHALSEELYVLSPDIDDLPVDVLDELAEKYKKLLDALNSHFKLEIDLLKKYGNRKKAFEHEAANNKLLIEDLGGGWNGWGKIKGEPVIYIYRKLILIRMHFANHIIKSDIHDLLKECLDK